MKHFERLGVCIFSFLVLNILSCKKEYSCEKCNKKLPVAIAGPDRLIQLPSSTLLLDGSASTDADGSITSFAWRKISGHNLITIVDPSSERTPVKYLNESVCLFELKVTDNDGLSSKDTVAITIKTDGSVNRPPVAQIEYDRYVITTDTSAATVTIHGDRSYDPDNNIVEYDWRQLYGPGIIIDNRYAANINISNLSNGIALLELKVTDSRGLFSKDTIELEIKIR